MKTVAYLLFLSVALLLFIGQPTEADAPPRYRLTVLPLDFQTADQMNSVLRGAGRINNAGQVVGETTVRSGKLSDPRTALWQKGHRLKILDKTPIASYANDGNSFSQTFSTGLNAQGWAVGGHYYSFTERAVRPLPLGMGI